MDKTIYAAYNIGVVHREEVQLMKQLNNVEFNSDEISALNDLLDARELTGQMPETMPTGLYNKDNSSNDCNCSGRCIMPIYAAVIPGSAGKWK